MKARDLVQYKGKGLRNHPIDWSDPRVSERGFGVQRCEFLDESAYQFSVSGNEHGRIIGALIDTVFYVIWFDPDHQLYPAQ